MTYRLHENYDTDPAIALTRALALIQKHRSRTFAHADHASYDAWIWAYTAVEQKRDWYRERNAERCAPWFEHQPTEAST